MELFLDTANLDEIKEIKQWGITTGLTTNQKIFSREMGCNFKERVREIVAMIDGPVSIEAPANNTEEIMKAAREYATWSKNIVIKVPMLPNGDGIRAVKQLRKEGMMTNMTALMSVNQVILSTLCGSTYASIFFNRVRDNGEDVEKIIQESRALIDNSRLPTKIIVGSIRKPQDVAQALFAGAHIVTVPYKILTQMPYHKKTIETLLTPRLMYLWDGMR